ncbi:hypothetical protein GQ55_9G087300 [Panicum hallii var. hallii]|uniref:Uncharacterized protein n=2 Tax=Panicum hallii TaxID=206008 RepID=A0A2T7C176_9POAL|nr:hypothetical protein GQ55_9G087300 [Panicum hallii var. hallii]
MRGRSADGSGCVACTPSGTAPAVTRPPRPHDLPCRRPAPAGSTGGGQGRARVPCRDFAAIPAPPPSGAVVEGRGGGIPGLFDLVPPSADGSWAFCTRIVPQLNRPAVTGPHLLLNRPSRSIQHEFIQFPSRSGPACHEKKIKGSLPRVDRCSQMPLRRHAASNLEPHAGPPHNTDPKFPTHQAHQPTDDEPMDAERRETDPPPPVAAAAAPRRAAAGGTPTASRGSSTASSSSSNSHPSAPASTGTPPSAVVPWAARAGDSCYYPGCRKDANCACEMCLASIDATRDLVRAPEAASARRFFAGAAAASRGRRPALFCRDRGAGAGSERTEPPSTPPMRSTAKSRLPPGQTAAAGRGARAAGSPHDWALYAATVLGFLLLLWVDTGLVPEAAARGFGPKLSPGAVARVGADARLAPGGLEHKLRVLEQRVGQLVGGERAANCSSQDSVWRLLQNDQQVFRWRCTVYKSVAEEVSVWGSPLRTSGLLPAALSARHLTLLSGEITEWSDGRVWPTVRASNGSSWAYRRKSAAAVRLEPETWVLEYQRSALFEGTRLIPAAAELLASRCSTMARRRLQSKRRLFGGAQASPT